MDWRTRIAAIVLAGGSVAGCASTADPGVDAGTPEPSPRSSGSGSSAEPLVNPPATIPFVKLPEVPARPRGRYQVPICNANPDPCCRAPSSPECAARRTAVEPLLRPPE